MYTVSADKKKSSLHCRLSLFLIASFVPCFDPAPLPACSRCCRVQFGTVTLGEHYKRIAVEGNDYDPYTTLFAGKKKPTNMIASLLGSQEVPAE